MSVSELIDALKQLERERKMAAKQRADEYPVASIAEAEAISVDEWRDTMRKADNYAIGMGRELDAQVYRRLAEQTAEQIVADSRELELPVETIRQGFLAELRVQVDAILHEMELINKQVAYRTRRGGNIGGGRVSEVMAGTPYVKIVSDYGDTVVIPRSAILPQR